MVRVKFENKLFRANVFGKSGETYTAFLIDIGRQIEVIARDIYDISDDLKKVNIHFVLICILFVNIMFYFNVVLIIDSWFS